MTKEELYTTLKQIEELTDKINEHKEVVVDALTDAELDYDNVFDTLDALTNSEMSANECYTILKENDYLDCLDGEEPVLDKPRRY